MGSKGSKNSSASAQKDSVVSSKKDGNDGGKHTAAKSSAAAPKQQDKAAAPASSTGNSGGQPAKTKPKEHRKTPREKEKPAHIRQTSRSKKVQQQKSVTIMEPSNEEKKHAVRFIQDAPPEQNTIDAEWNDMSPPQRYVSESAFSRQSSVWAADNAKDNAGLLDDDEEMRAQLASRGMIVGDATQEEIDLAFSHIRQPSRTISEISGLTSITGPSSGTTSAATFARSPTPSRKAFSSGVSGFAETVPEDQYLTRQGTFEAGRERTESASTFQGDNSSPVPTVQRVVSDGMPSTGLIDDAAAVAAASDPQQIHRIEKAVARKERKERERRLSERSADSAPLQSTSPISAKRASRRQVDSEDDENDIKEENDDASVESEPGPQRKPSLVDKDKEIGTDVLALARKSSKKKGVKSSKSAPVLGKKKIVRKNGGVGIVARKVKVSRSTGKVKTGKKKVSNGHANGGTTELPSFLQNAVSGQAKTTTTRKTRSKSKPVKAPAPAAKKTATVRSSSSKSVKTAKGGTLKKKTKKTPKK